MGTSFDWLRRQKGCAQDDCLVWPFGKTAAGYGACYVDGEIKYAHRIMCTWAHGEPTPEKNHAAHLCGNPSCVNPAHLKWKSAKDNAADKLRHGTDNRGEKCGTSKLLKSQVIEICQLLDAGMLQKEVAKIYGVKTSAIADINIGRNWNWLTKRKSAPVRSLKAEAA